MQTAAACACGLSVRPEMTKRFTTQAIFLGFQYMIERHIIKAVVDCPSLRVYNEVFFCFRERFNLGQ